MPIVVKKGWLMYEVANQTETTYCLYKHLKDGSAISISMYVKGNEAEAIEAFKRHIPFLTNAKDINMNGLLINKK